MNRVQPGFGRLHGIAARLALRSDDDNLTKTYFRQLA
jgi:hypothetical protein